MNGPHDAPERSCPRCGEAMEAHDVGGVELDVCLRQGIWFDDGERDLLRRRAAAERRRGWQARKRPAVKALEEGEGLDWLERVHEIREAKRRNPRARYPQTDRLIPEADPDGRKAAANEALRCPVCGRAMVVEVRKDRFEKTPAVTMNLCRDHGVWPDHGKAEILSERARLDAGRVVRSKVRRARWEGRQPRSGGGCGGGCGGRGG